jgi:hypothetical protein
MQILFTHLKKDQKAYHVDEDFVFSPFEDVSSIKKDCCHQY